MSEFKSKKEMAQAILDGKIVVFEGGRMAYWEEQNVQPFRLSHLNTPLRSEGLDFFWERWDEAKIKKEWYENITKPVPCWVSDTNPNARITIAVILSYNRDDEHPFKSRALNWEYATPLKSEDLLQEVNK